MQSVEPQSLKSILSIQTFKLPSDEIKQIYPRVYSLPQFFTHNLVSPRRVVKLFSGKFALVQAFYYQLMKLSLQIQVQGINYRDILFRKLVQNQLFVDGELQDELFTDFQYRKFMKDFIQIVEAGDLPNFQAQAETYPIIDDILQKLFRKIVPFPMLIQKTNGIKGNRDAAAEILNFLCQIFQVSFTQVGDCFKFDQADMFVYLQNKEEVYLAYNQQYTQSEQPEEESQFKSTFVCGQGNSFLTKYHTKSALTPEQMDMMHTLKSNKNGKQPTIKQLVSSQEQFCKKRHKQHDQMQGKLTQNYDYNPNRNQFKKSYDKVTLVTNMESMNNTKSITSFLQSAMISIAQSTPIATKQNKGQLYDQFTNSFVLQQMDYKFQAPIRTIKNKYRKERDSIRSFF